MCAVCVWLVTAAGRGQAGLRAGWDRWVRAYKEHLSTSGNFPFKGKCFEQGLMLIKGKKRQVLNSVVRLFLYLYLFAVTEH